MCKVQIKNKNPQNKKHKTKPGKLFLVEGFRSGSKEEMISGLGLE